jgi:hypothetical protein
MHRAKGRKASPAGVSASFPRLVSNRRTPSSSCNRDRPLLTADWVIPIDRAASLRLPNVALKQNIRTWTRFIAYRLHSGAIQTCAGHRS